MAFMGVLSTNPDFSYLIKKSPASGMIVKDLRQGHLFGYYSKKIHSIDDGSGVDTNELPAIQYCIYFRDGANEISYKEFDDQEFEYMNVTRYNSPLFVLDGIFNLLNSLAKDETHEKDTVGHFHSYKINMMECNPNYLDIFKRTFKDFNMVFTPYPVRGEKVYNYQVVVSTNKRTLRELTNLVALFAMFQSIKCNHLSMLGEDQVEKYMKVLKTMDVPYMIRYTFKIHLLRSLNLFKKFKQSLEQSDSLNLSLTFGNAYMERQQVVFKHLEKRPNSILDIGCGEGRYIPYLTKRLQEGAFYYAVDTDPEVLEDATHLIRKKQIENAVTHASLDAFLESDVKDPLDILCTEVIEHMEIEEATALVHKLIKLPNAKSLLITTPNSDFSKYYNADHEDGDVDRHDDHKWEYNNAEFQLWVEQKVKPVLKKQWGVFDFQYLHIGDNVNGQCPTQGFIARASNYIPQF